VILLALALLGFGIADLVRWTPESVCRLRAVVAVAVGTGSVALVASLGGMSLLKVLAVSAISLVVLSLWSAASSGLRPRLALTLIGVVVLVAIGLSGSVGGIGGDVATWYSGLGFGFVRRMPVDQFVLGVGVTLFLLATANRIVHLTLHVVRPSLVSKENSLHGGRILGPMERLIVAAAVLSGDLLGAGFVIAAKGLLRFREIGGASDVDEVTEYFLIGTFTSIILAAAAAVLLLAAA
jgi:hypothetical protein